MVLKPLELMCFAHVQPRLTFQASPSATAEAEAELKAAELDSGAQPLTDHSQPLSYHDSALGVDVDTQQQGLPVEEQAADAAAAETQQASWPVSHGLPTQPQAVETQALPSDSAQAQHAEQEGRNGSTTNLDTHYVQQQSTVTVTQDQQGAAGDTQQAEQDSDEQMQDAQQPEFGNALLSAEPQQPSLSAAAAAAADPNAAVEQHNAEHNAEPQQHYLGAAPNAAVEQHNAEAMVPLPEGLLQDSQQSPEAQHATADASQANQVRDACTDQPSADTVMLEAEHGQQSDNSHPDEAQHAQQAGHSILQEAQHAHQEPDSVMTEALPPQEPAGSVRPEPQHAQHRTLSSRLDSSQEPPRRSRRLVGSVSKADGDENAADCPESAGSPSPLPAAPPSGDAAQAGSSVAANQGVGKQSEDEGQAGAGAEVSHAQQDTHPLGQGEVVTLHSIKCVHQLCLWLERRSIKS